MKPAHLILPILILGGLLSCKPQEHELQITEYVDLFMPREGDGTADSPEASLPFGGVRIAPEKQDNFFTSLSLYNAGCRTTTAAPAIRFLPTALGDSLNKPIDEQARPGYYGVTFENGIKTETAVTERCAIIYYQYPPDSPHSLLLNLASANKNDSVKSCVWQVNNRRLEGYCKYTDKRGERQTNFVIEFSQDCRTFTDKTRTSALENGHRFTAYNSCLRLDFGVHTNKILVKASISSANIEGAAANLEKELSHWSFDKVVRDAKQAWKRELQKIKVEGGTEQQQKEFYTSLYYAFLSPAIASDANGNYDGPDGEIHSARQYTHYAVCPSWEDIKDIPPLLAITQKKRVYQFLNSAKSDYRFGEKNYILPAEKDVRKNDAYILSAIGFHSISPEDNAFHIGTPIFNKTIIRTSPDKRFVISAPRESDKQIYIEQVLYNNRPLTKLSISFEEIMQGGKLNFVLTDR